MVVVFIKRGVVVYGYCGGHCGVCKPDPSIGLQLKFADI